MRNTLQVSQGKRIDSLDQLPNYAEVAFQAGIPATDWSWTPMIADFDLDSYRDVIITNGFPRDITDHDFGDFNNETSRYFSVKNTVHQTEERSLSRASNGRRYSNFRAGDQ